MGRTERVTKRRGDGSAIRETRAPCRRLRRDGGGRDHGRALHYLRRRRRAELRRLASPVRSVRQRERTDSRGELDGELSYSPPSAKISEHTCSGPGPFRVARQVVIGTSTRCPFGKHFLSFFFLFSGVTSFVFSISFPPCELLLVSFLYFSHFFYFLKIKNCWIFHQHYLFLFYFYVFLLCFVFI
jgi:hypothetical protein